MICANCGKEVREGNRFCPYCGEGMAEKTPLSEQRPMQAVPPSPPPYSSGKYPPGKPPAGPPARRNRVIAVVVLIIGLLVIAGGVTAFLLTRDSGETVEAEESSGGEEDGEESRGEESAESSLQSAKDEAELLLEQADSSLRELEGMGVDTSDLADEMRNAQMKFDTAGTSEDYIGASGSSSYYSKLVIDGCEEKKFAYEQGKAAEAAAAERNRQMEKCVSDVLAELKRSIDPTCTYSPNVLYMNDSCTYAELGVACNDAQGYPCQGFRVEARRQGDTWVITRYIDPSEE